MSATRLTAAPSGVPLRLRLKAWWNGCDVVMHRRHRATPDANATPARRVIGARDPARPWETPRVQLAQLLWGAGFSHPGGPEEVLHLAKPFGLDPAMTVLDLTAGLGGGPRALAESFGVWVTGLEQDKEFAEAGRELSRLGGYAKKANIAAFAPASVELRPSSIDCVMCRQLFHGVPDKPRLLRTIYQALKPRGQLLFTDFMLAEPGREDSEAVRAWIASEPMPVAAWTVEECARALACEKLDVRITEDITAPFRRMVIGAWADLIAGAADATLTDEFKQCMVTELERWARRIAAFDSGDLRVYRVYARKPADTKLLSDW